ncbi:MAG: nodulation protein NfeD [Candidatus Hydrogenedentota bacterium]
MKRIFLFSIVLLISFATQIKGVIYHSKVDGPIDPIIARYIENTILKAEREGNVTLIVFEINTPGGLVDSMETIVKAISNTHIPVCIYVAPKTARAASAGAFIALSADIIAMAPQTHIGAAHPVTMGSNPEKSKTKPWDEWLKENKEDTKRVKRTPPLSNEDAMMEKITNYLAAKAKSLAKAHNRNETWAEKSVRESIITDEEQAYKDKVIEIIAEDFDELITKIQGLKINKFNKEIILDLEDKSTRELEMSFSEYFLHSIANPQVAYFLLILGFFGIFFEFKAGGIGFPGVFGGICLILAFVSLQMLPINIAGLLLIILGIILLILEVKIVSYGILTIGGIISFVFGSMILIDSPKGATYYSIPMGMISGVTVALVLFIFIVGFFAVKIFRKKIETGKEGLIDKIGIVKERLAPSGYIRVEGELWQAKSVNAETIEAGAEVVVKEVQARILIVEKR